jgi:hypothetical protein
MNPEEIGRRPTRVGLPYQNGGLMTRHNLYANGKFERSLTTPPRPGLSFHIPYIYEATQENFGLDFSSPVY